MAESKEEQKSLLMKVKKESGKADLKLNIQKTSIIASGPITSGQKSLQTVTTDMKLKDTCSLKESYDQTRPCIKQQRHYW